MFFLVGLLYMLLLDVVKWKSNFLPNTNDKVYIPNKFFILSLLVTFIRKTFLVLT